MMILLNRLYDTWYVQSRTGNKWIFIWLRYLSIGWGIPLVLLAIIGIPNGIMALTIGQAGIWIAYSDNIKFIDKLSAVGLLLFKPLVMFIHDGAAGVLLFNAMKTMGLSLIGVGIISILTLSRESWSVRIRLFLSLLGALSVFSMLPCFSLVFATVFPVITFFAIGRWQPNHNIRKSLIIVPSFMALIGPQLFIEKFDPRLWVNPFTAMSGMTPREYYAKLEFKKLALMGADAGDIYTIQMVLRDFDLTPKQRFRYLGMLRRYPNQRTKAIDKEYQELAAKLDLLPKSTESMPLGFRVLLTEDKILNDNSVSDTIRQARKRELADRWNELHPDEPIPGY